MEDLAATASSNLTSPRVNLTFEPINPHKNLAEGGVFESIKNSLQSLRVIDLVFCSYNNNSNNNNSNNNNNVTHFLYVDDLNFKGGAKLTYGYVFLFRSYFDSVLLGVDLDIGSISGALSEN